MIQYVVSQNPDDRILKKASQVLAGGGLVSLPTDTNWVVVVDIFSKLAVEKLYRLKKAVDQALMLRGSRDFLSRQEYEQFLEQMFEQLNVGRQERWREELKALGRLPARRQHRVAVSLYAERAFVAVGYVYSADQSGAVRRAQDDRIAQRQYLVEGCGLRP